MDTMDIPRLMATPTPKKNESFKGYTLRLSEANGLVTPATMLGLAGMDQKDIRLARHPVEIIAGLTGKEVAEFSGITYSDDNVSGETRLLGQPLSLAYMSLRDPKICPYCIDELGYIPACWDLVSYTICHVHNMRLLSECPHCNQKLKWLRPGVLQCHCGQSLKAEPSEAKVYRTAELHRVMDAVLRKVRLANTDSSSGMPFEALTMMSLNTLLGVLHALGAHKIHLENGTTWVKALIDPEAELEAASDILAEWPNGFLRLLEMDMRAAKKQSTSLRLRHGPLYSKLFKMGYPEAETQLFLDAMVLHANNHPDKYVIDTRIAKKATVASERRGSGIYQAAKLAGVMPSTMRKWIKAGKTEVVIDARGKALIKGNFIESLLPLAEESLGIREAAAYVGLPVAVLKYLREQAVYQAKHRTVLPYSFAIPDLQSMVVNFLSLAKPSHDHDLNGLVTLSELMRKKFRSDTIKAQLLQAIFNSELEAYGNPESIGEILVSLQAATTLADKLMTNESGRYLVRQAVAIIGCDIGSIGGLIQMGLLTTHIEHGAVYLERDQVDAFALNYIPLVRVLKPHGMSSARGARVCANSGMEILSVPRQPGNQIQTFIKRADSEKLLQLMKER
jgi:hypothetical protein